MLILSKSCDVDEKDSGKKGSVRRIAVMIDSSRLGWSCNREVGSCREPEGQEQ